VTEKQIVYTEMQTWGISHLLAGVWYCGDEQCACSQAQIEQIDPNLNAGPPWIRREPVWQGTFHSDAEPGAEADLERRLVELEAEGTRVVRTADKGNSNG
jgi:hypothetical protein